MGRGGGGGEPTDPPPPPQELSKGFLHQRLNDKPESHAVKAEEASACRADSEERGVTHVWVEEREMMEEDERPWATEAMTM